MMYVHSSPQRCGTAASKTTIARALLLVLLIITGIGSSNAQLASATINGTVRDQSGAVIPDATIDVRNQDTGLVRTTTTNASGTYGLSQIPPGIYTIEASLKGFSSSRRENVTLSVSQSSAFDFTLTLGSTVSTVEVQASAVSLETATTTIGNTLSTETVNTLPLNGRNYTELLLLEPGVTRVNGDQTGGRTNSVGGAVFPSIQGQNNRSNSYYLDGVNNNEAISGAQTITPIPDDIQEMRVLSHSDYAQFGGAMGGVINIVTKQGTNALHGSAWEFWRGSRFMDAKNPITGVLQDLHQNQYGFSIGGPVLLPKYNGRDRTFFFGSYEGFRQKIGATSLQLVPTTAQLNGDFSGISATIYNPYSNSGGTPAPFTGNQIPANLIDQNMVALAKALFPAPNGSYSGGKFNYQNTTPQTHNSDQFDVRVDEYLSKHDQIWAHYLHQNNPIITYAGFPGLLRTSGYVAHNFGAQWIHTFGSATVLTVGFGQNIGLDTPTTSYSGNVASVLQGANFSNTFACGFAHGIRSSGCMLPALGMGAYAGGGENQGSPNYTSNVWEYSADLQHRFGRHTLYAGFNVDTNNQGQATSAGPNLTFSTIQTSNGNTGGNELASFLLGLPDGWTRPDIQDIEHGGYVQGYYVQDQWKARDNLTINIGLRYDLSLIPIVGDSRYGSYYTIFDYNQGVAIVQNLPPPCSSTQFAPCVPGGTLPAHVVVSSEPGKLFFADKSNIQPRFGLTYSWRPDTVWHLAYGRVYDNWAGVDQTAQNVNGWLMNTTPQAAAINRGGVTTATAIKAENPTASFTANTPPPSPFFVGFGWNTQSNFKAPYTDQWTFGVQQRLGAPGVWTINYVGSRGSNLDYGHVANRAPAPGPGAVNPRRPFPYMGSTFFDTPWNQLDYHALETTFQGRTGKLGLTYLLSYTWSKGIDVGADGWYGVGNNTSSIQDPYGFYGDRSVTGYDLPHVFSAGWTWSVPIRKGAYSTGNQTVDYVVGNWKLNGTIAMESGRPFTVYDSGDIANVGDFTTYMRPNRVGDPHLANPSRQMWFNTAAFATPAQYTYGNTPRNSLRTESFKNLDMSLFREFPFYREASLQLRLDAFNVFNHPVWGIPGTTQNGTNFGVVNSTANSPRQMQLSGKIVF